MAPAASSRALSSASALSSAAAGSRMHRHGRIAQHRLRPRRGQGHALRLARLGVDDGIVEVPEVARHGLVKDLVVADGRLQHGVPVHQPLAAIDQPVAEHLEERMPHRPGALRIEREAGPLPIAGAAHFLELAEDPLFVVVLPLPDAGHEPLAAQLVPAELFLLQQAAFDHGLRGDARVVGARHPQGLEALHPFLADEDVLQRVVQGVAQVQGAGDVGRRDDDRVGLLRLVRLAMEEAFGFPEGVPALLRGGGIVLLGEVRHGTVPLSLRERAGEREVLLWFGSSEGICDKVHLSLRERAGERGDRIAVRPTNPLMRLSGSSSNFMVLTQKNLCNGHARRPRDSHAHRLRIAHHIGVGHTKYPQSLLFQVRRTFAVLFRTILMACTIDFHDQPNFMAKEIDNIRPNRMLSTELQSTKSASP